MSFKFLIYDVHKCFVLNDLNLFCSFYSGSLDDDEFKKFGILIFSF